MGDRAILWIERASAALYLHWGGHSVAELLRIAGPTMRRGDPNYAQARLIGAACKMYAGDVCGVGVVSTPKEGQSFDDYSHGDAGVFVIDSKSGVVTTHGGYGWGDSEPVVVQWGGR